MVQLIIVTRRKTLCHWLNALASLAGPDLGERWLSGLVATAAEPCRGVIAGTVPVSVSCKNAQASSNASQIARVLLKLNGPAEFRP